MRTELQRWITTDSLWNRKAVLRTSPVAALGHRPNVPRKSSADGPNGPRFSVCLAGEEDVLLLLSFLLLCRILRSIHHRGWLPCSAMDRLHHIQLSRYLV